MKEKINVAFILNNISNGGIESFFYNYLNNYNFKEKFNITIIYSNKHDKIMAKKFENIGVKIIKTKYNINSNQIRYFFELISLFKNTKFDIIHCNLMQNSVYPLVAGKVNKIKCRIVHTHMNMAEDCCVHSLKSKIIKKIKMYLCDLFSTKRLACSNIAGKSSFNKEFEVIYNAIDISKFNQNLQNREIIREKLGISKETILYGFFGRLHQEKNPIFAYNVYKESKKLNKDVKMIFIGYGGLKDEMLKKIENEPDILYKESVDDIQNYYNAIDLLIFPSLSEGLGMVAIEAQLSKTPVIASNMVPVDTKISNYIYFEDLTDGEKKWAKMGLKITRDKDEPIIYNELVNNYNINTQAKKLFNIYINEVENEKR